MQPGLSEVAGDVEADPGAVFEAHGAESVDELVTEGTSERGSQGDASAERDTDSDRAVSQLFAGGLDRPERTPSTEPASSTHRTRESTTTPAVLADLERAIDETDAQGPGDADGTDIDALDDDEVADALAVAEELDGTGTDGELAEDDIPVSVPEDWRDD